VYTIKNLHVVIAVTTIRKREKVTELAYSAKEKPAYQKATL